MIRQIGDKLRTNEVKAEILKYLADDEHSGSDLRKYLNEKFGITEARGVRKHLSLLRQNGYLDGLKLEDDYNSYRNIVLFLEENKNNLDWETSEFTHGTKYGIKHINEEMIGRWLEEAFKKFYMEENIKLQRYTAKGARNIIAGGMSKEELLTAARISPSVLLYFLHTEKITFHPKGVQSWREQRGYIFKLLMSDALDERDLVESVIEIRNIEPSEYKKENGLKLELSIEIYPKKVAK